jgi:serine/threonine-protein kinase RsbW
LQQAESSTERHAFTKEFAFAGDAGSIPEARDTILQFLTEHGVSGEEEIDMLLALQEALANAVFHGCGDDASKTIRSTVEITPEEIKIIVLDPGAGFDTSPTDSTEDDINLTEHGRGILLMRNLMDEISYHQGGSELRMRKRRMSGEEIDAPASSPPASSRR